MEDLSPVFRQARCSVRHESLALRTSDLGTQVGLVALTVNTIISGAFGSVARNDNISDGDRGDVRTDGLNDGSSFMSGNTEIQKIDTVVLITLFEIFLFGLMINDTTKGNLGQLGAT